MEFMLDATPGTGQLSDNGHAVKLYTVPRSRTDNVSVYVCAQATSTSIRIDRFQVKPGPVKRKKIEWESIA